VCFEWISEKNIRFCPTETRRLIFIIEVESVYCAVRADSLHATYVSPLKGYYNIIIDAGLCIAFCARITVGDGLHGLDILY